MSKSRLTPDEALEYWRIIESGGRAVDPTPKGFTSRSQSDGMPDDQWGHYLVSQAIFRASDRSVLKEVQLARTLRQFLDGKAPHLSELVESFKSDLIRVMNDIEFVQQTFREALDA